MATVRIPQPLRDVLEGARELEVPGANVRDLLAGLARLWPATRRHLWADEDHLAPGVTVFVGVEQARVRGGLDAPVGDDETVFLVLPLLVGH